MKKNKFYITYIALIASLLSGCAKKEEVVIDTAIPEVIETAIDDYNLIIEEKDLRKEPTAIDIMMIGDILVHEPVYKSGIMEDGTLNYDHFFENITEDIETADIAIVNQETILGGSELGFSSYPCFNSPQEIGDAEAKAGFNTILHATNHTLDRGLKAINNTMTFWKEKYPDINVLGLNETEEDTNNIMIYEEDDFKVAILNYTYGTNGINPPSDKPYIVNVLDEDRVTKDISVAKELADMVVVCPHWGTEYVYKPDSLQEKYTKLFYDLGVDVVIGTHPHVLENVELIKEEGNSHEMLVYYSLGNFVSGQTEKPRVVGGMAKVTLIKDYESNECYIEEYELDPLITQQGAYTTYLLKDYNNDLANENRIKNRSGCSDFSFEYVNNLCEDILGSDYNEVECRLVKTLR